MRSLGGDGNEFGKFAFIQNTFHGSKLKTFPTNEFKSINTLPLVSLDYLFLFRLNLSTYL